MHPVLANSTCLAVRDELIGIERDLEVEIVVNHDLECLALDTISFVLIDRFSVNTTFGTITVTVNLPVLIEFAQKLRRKLFMILFGNVAQCVF